MRPDGSMTAPRPPSQTTLGKPSVNVTMPNLSGFAGPYMMGFLKDLTGNFTAGLLVLGSCGLAGAIVVMMLRVDNRLEVADSAKSALAH